MLQLKSRSAGVKPVWLVNDQYRIGADARCDIKVAGCTHVVILHVHPASVEIVPEGGCSVKVNQCSTTKTTTLSVGDEFSVGNVGYVIIDPKSELLVSNQSSRAKALRGIGRSMLNYVLHDEEHPDSEISIFDGFIVGRSVESDLRVDMADISLNHAFFQMLDDGLLLYDAGSSSGTFVNGEKITSLLVKCGDKLSFGNHTYYLGRAESEENDLDRTTLRPAISSVDSSGERVSRRSQNLDSSAPMVSSSGPVKIERSSPRGLNSGVNASCSAVTEGNQQIIQPQVSGMWLNFTVWSLFAAMLGLCYYLVIH